MVDFYRHLQKNKYGVWHKAENKPQKSGESYLVVLKKDNSFEYTNERPIIAEFGFYKSKPNNWTIFNNESRENEIADDDVLYWMELPKIPLSNINET